MTDRTRRGWGVVVATLALLFGIISFVAAPEESVAVVVQQWIFAITIVGVGLLIVLKRPAHRIGFVMLGVGLSFSLMGTGQTFTRLAYQSGERSTAIIWAQVEGVAWVFFILTLFNLLPLWFPTGTTTGVVGRWLQRVALAVAVAAAFGTVFADLTCVSWPVGGIEDECLDFAMSSWGFVHHSLAEEVGQGVLLLTGLLSLFNLAHRLVKSRGQERQQLKWFALGFGMFGVALVTSQVLGTNMDLVIWTAIAVVPASIALAVLRYRLYEIDRIVSRTITYAIVVFLLAGSFLTVAALLGAGVSEDPLFVAAATLAAAALFNPLRARLQLIIDRRFNRSRFDAEAVMTDFSGSLQDRVDADVIVDGWRDVVSETMQPSTVGVWVRK